MIPTQSKSLLCTTARLAQATPIARVHNNIGIQITAIPNEITEAQKIAPEALNPEHQPGLPFGELTLGTALSTWLERSQKMPANWFGKQIGQLIHKHVERNAEGFHDIESCRVRLRSNFSDNTSERTFTFLPWRFDEAERAYISQHITQDGTFVDIGGNVGVYTLWAAKKLGGKRACAYV